MNSIEIEERIVTFEVLLELQKLKAEKGLKDVIKFKQKVLWALDNLNPKLHFICGNAKLPKETMIINLGTWFNCSGRKEKFCDICQQCYDKQPEVRFKERIKDRLEQEIFFRSHSAEELITIILANIDYWNNHHKTKIKNIRWSEVGELRNQKDLNKIIKISNEIFKKRNIKSYIYTHNQSLDFWSTERPGLVINGSGFMVDNEYRVVNKNERENEYNTLEDISNKRDCICDCTRCGYCLEKNGFILIEELR